ncbi:MAG: glycoside hydrolase family 28 protein [Patescibacteria group bacterium]
MKYIILIFCLLAVIVGAVSVFVFFDKKFQVSSLPEFVEVAGVPERVCDISDYGAVKNSGALSTDAINSAINDCYAEGGGTVYVPEGQWKSGAIKLKSNINFFLSEGSVINFTTDLNEYLPVEITRIQGMELYNYSPLIYAKDAENVAITGAGKLYGQGDDRESWSGGGVFSSAREHLYEMAQNGVQVSERVFGDREPGLRPSFIQFMNCKNVLIDGITVENGPFWTIHPVYTDGFVVRNAKINTWSGNTDGIDIDSTKNVLIEDTWFSTGDDAIAIKSGLEEDGWRVDKASENIEIRNITVVKGSSGVSIGSEMSGGVSNVQVRDSHFENARHGFRVKTTRSRGGYMKDIHVENITMDNITGDVIDFNFAYSTEVKSDVSKKPVIENISLKNIHGKGNERLAVNIDGSLSFPVENIYMEDIFFTESERAVDFKKAKNVTLKNVNVELIETAEGSIYEFENSQNINLQSSKCQSGANPCMLVSGVKTKNILIEDVDFSEAEKNIEITDGAQKQSVNIK